jgi:ribonuclease D
VIDTQDELTALLPLVQRSPRVALDTEADSLHAYPEKLCLVQLSLADGDFLIDPLAGLDFRPLLDLLRNKELILHGADYDLRLLLRTFQFVPTRIFDTMWAARLLGQREFGLGDLVRQHLNVALEKGPQKMNWALRPLPERMATYALNDTRYLPPLADLLAARLQEQARMEWQREVCARVIEECARPRLHDPEVLWRVKGSDRLDRRALAVLRTLWQWREEEAIQANKPPYFILSHEILVALSSAATRNSPGPRVFPPHLPAKRANRLATAIERGLEVPPEQFPDPRRSFGVRLTKEQQKRFGQLKEFRDRRATELGLDPTIIANKADLVLLAKGMSPAQAELMSWQRKVLELG